MSNEDFVSFEKALRDLKMQSSELKKLVSEGEIRAFRDGDNMKLRRQDVENLRAELSGGEVVDLGESTEELVFEDDGFEDPMMATQEVETVIEDLGDDDEMMIEDIGEDDDDAYEAPVRRQGAAAAVAVEEETEDSLTRFALIAASLVLLASVPVLLSLAKGDGIPSDMAKTIGGIFNGALGQ